MSRFGLQRRVWFLDEPRSFCVEKRDCVALTQRNKHILIFSRRTHLVDLQRRQQASSGANECPIPLAVSEVPTQTHRRPPPFPPPTSLPASVLFLSVAAHDPTEESPSPVEPDTPPPVSTATPFATSPPTEVLGTNEGGGDDSSFSFSYSYDSDDSDDGGYVYDEVCLTCERASFFMTPADWVTLEDEGLELVCDPDCLKDDALDGCGAFGLDTACRTIPLVVEPVSPGTPAPAREATPAPQADSTPAPQAEATPAPQAEAAPTPRLETPSPVAMMMPSHSDGGDNGSGSSDDSSDDGGSSDDTRDDSSDSGNEACAKFNEQCGGEHYTGTTCCEAGLTCKEWTDVSVPACTRTTTLPCVRTAPRFPGYT